MDLSAGIRAACLAAFLAGLAVISLAGCSSVKQYQKEHLGNPMMVPGSNPLERELDAHNFGNREGSTTGGGASGGGCGC